MRAPWTEDADELGRAVWTATHQDRLLAMVHSTEWTSRIVWWARCDWNADAQDFHRAFCCATVEQAQQKAEAWLAEAGLWPPRQGSLFPD